LHAHTIGPDGQLLDRRRPERIPGAQNHPFALVAEQTRQLGDRRRLARAVNAHDHDHRRAGGGKGDRLFRLGQKFQKFGLDDLENIFHADDAGAMVGLDLFANRIRGARAHIGANEQGKQIAHKIVVDQSPLLLEQVADIGVQQLGGAFQASLEASQNPFRRSEWPRVALVRHGVRFVGGSLCRHGRLRGQGRVVALRGPRFALESVKESHRLSVLVCSRPS